MKRPAAGTGLGDQPGEVAGPIADYREGLFGQGRDHDFAGLAWRHRL